MPFERMEDSTALPTRDIGGGVRFKLDDNDCIVPVRNRGGGGNDKVAGGMFNDDRGKSDDSGTPERGGDICCRGNDEANIEKLVFLKTQAQNQIAIFLCRKLQT
jgi:hypothetical protein